jgi:two-component system LytT family sensor kinase
VLSDVKLTGVMLSRSKSKLITILIHVLVWAVFGLAIFFRYPVFIGNGISYQLWVTQSVTLILLVIAFYVNSSILVPAFLLKNNTAYYFVIIIAIVVTIVLINSWMETAFIVNSQDRVPEMLKLPRFRNPGQVRHIDTLTIIISALVIVIGTSMTVIQKWQKDKQERAELEKDKVTSELSFLKAQINPHFFFNTLNNIYALTKVDADEAGKAIHQLSRMMRYLLYETQQGPTMLSQEIAFVKDYISLMQLRLTDVVRVVFDAPTHLLDMPMAPMMLLPFVENAFKHGVSATQQSHIYIMVTQKDSVLDMTVKNSIMKDKSLSLDTNSGIGLVNTRRRLDLLYPGKYKLDICELNACDEYSVHLMLDLK